MCGSYQKNDVNIITVALNCSTIENRSYDTIKLVEYGKYLILKDDY